MSKSFLDKFFFWREEENSQEKEINRKIALLEARMGEILGILDNSDIEQKIQDNSQSLENINDALEIILKRLENIKTNENELKQLNRRENRINDLESTQKQVLSEESILVESDKNSINRPPNRPSVLASQSDNMEKKAENAVKGEKLWKKTTPAQKNVIKILYDSGYPMSYKEIANKLNRTVSTVKNHMNNLKSLGVNFEETTGKNNSKRYRLDRRIKEFLTMKLND